MNTFNLEFKDIIFHAHHGMYENEKIKGNKFRINATISYVAKNKENTYTIEDIIDYSQIYIIIKNRMLMQYTLLENLLYDIAEDIRKKYNIVKYIFLKIEKRNPVINNLNGIIGVSFEKKIEI